MSFRLWVRVPSLVCRLSSCSRALSRASVRASGRFFCLFVWRGYAIPLGCALVHRKVGRFRVCSARWPLLYRHRHSRVVAHRRHRLKHRPSRRSQVLLQTSFQKRRNQGPGKIVRSRFPGPTIFSGLGHYDPIYTHGQVVNQKQRPLPGQWKWQKQPLRRGFPKRHS